jgi:predicted NBD/HSP70 family sugar kinase
MDRLTWRGRELVRLVHVNPGLSRASTAKKLDMSTGVASDLASSIAASHWLSEAAAPLTGGRGRPTKVFAAHPDGPLVLGAALRHEDWQVDAFEIGGHAVSSVHGSHDGGQVTTLRALEEGCQSLRHRFAARVVGVGVAVPGPVRDRRAFTVTGLDWPEVDLRALWPQWESLTVGNDATLAGVAESRRGASQGSSSSLHLLIEAGIGGGIVDRGKAMDGYRGVAGEFGHLPFGDRDVECPCGLRGCWGTSVDGGALARLLGDGEPASPVAYATQVLRRARDGSAREAAALEAVADELGRGIGALVNALDPEVVTLGGLADEIATFAPGILHTSYQLGLMPVRRRQSPPLLRAALGSSGSLIGAAEQVWDDVFEAAVL